MSTQRSLRLKKLSRRTLSQKERTPPTNPNVKCRRGMKLIPVNMNYCLLKFYALKIVLGVRLHGGLYLTFIFSI